MRAARHGHPRAAQPVAPVARPPLPPGSGSCSPATAARAVLRAREPSARRLFAPAPASSVQSGLASLGSAGGPHRAPPASGGPARTLPEGGRRRGHRPLCGAGRHAAPWGRMPAPRARARARQRARARACGRGHGAEHWAHVCSLARGALEWSKMWTVYVAPAQPRGGGPPPSVRRGGVEG